MNAKEFRALIADLAALTPVQKGVVMSALTASSSASEAVDMIEAQFAEAPACGHCGSEAFSKWGVATVMRCYMRKSCGRAFNALTGTPLAHVHMRDKWLEYAGATADGVSLRKAAKRVGVHLETSFRWRHGFLAASRNVKATSLGGIVEADETFILASAKGSKRLMGRATRKRGRSAERKGISTDEHDCILVLRFKGWIAHFKGVTSWHLSC